MQVQVEELRPYLQNFDLFQRFLLLCAQVQVIGCPMLRVPVWGDRPEHLDHSAAPQVDHPAPGRYLHRVHTDVALSVRVHPPVAAELSQPDRIASTKALLSESNCRK